MELTVADRATSSFALFDCQTDTLARPLPVLRDSDAAVRIFGLCTPHKIIAFVHAISCVTALSWVIHGVAVAPKVGPGPGGGQSTAGFDMLWAIARSRKAATQASASPR